MSDETRDEMLLILATLQVGAEHGMPVHEHDRLLARLKELLATAEEEG